MECPISLLKLIDVQFLVDNERQELVTQFHGDLSIKYQSLSIVGLLDIKLQQLKL
jgi:hypothetical protein